MVLPGDALGSDTRGFEIDIGSGFTDNAAAAENTLDPNDTARELTRAGRIVGYDLSYSDLSCAPFIRGRGLLSIGSSLDLFKSARAADAFITKQLRDARRFRGKLVEGLRLVASSSFPAGTIGDRSVGLRTTGMIGDKHFNGTLVGFRVGTLVASVEVDRADAQPVTTVARQLARALAARIQLASAGKLKAEPVPVPPVGRKGHRPAGEPDLAAMAISVGDLPKGTKLTRQGYVDDRSAIGSYEREFDTSAARSRANWVESDVSLFRHTKEATAFHCLLRVIYSSATAEQWFAKATGESSLKLEQRPSLTVGDESLALVLRVHGVRLAFVDLRVGRVVGSLMVAGPASSFHFADATPLANTFAKQIQRGL